MPLPTRHGISTQEGGRMKRFVSDVLVAGVCIGTLLALAGRPVAAADDEVVRADRAWVETLEKGNTGAANKMLDPDFTWIDTDGVMWAREDTFRAGLKPLVPSGSDVKIIEHKYGKVVWIQENQGNKYAAHFWVQHPEGWRLLHNSEIATRPRSENPDSRPFFAIPCVNPCKEIPLKAVTPNEQAALAAWQEQESGVPEQWRRHVADDNVVVSSYGLLTKDERWAFIQKHVQSNAPQVGVSPVLWARMWDFDTAVVMVACQPNWGGKAYWASRVFAKGKDGTWLMTESYRTTIQASPVMTAVPGQ
jgi:hypothetical protein